MVKIHPRPMSTEEAFSFIILQVQTKIMTVTESGYQILISIDSCEFISPFSPQF